jgi:hypothetical protein
MSTSSGIARYLFEPNYLTIDGIRLHYVDDGEGHPMAQLHVCTNAVIVSEVESNSVIVAFYTW